MLKGKINITSDSPANHNKYFTCYQFTWRTPVCNSLTLSSILYLSAFKFIPHGDQFTWTQRDRTKSYWISIIRYSTIAFACTQELVHKPTSRKQCYRTSADVYDWVLVKFLLVVPYQRTLSYIHKKLTLNPMLQYWRFLMHIALWYTCTM